MCWNQTASGVFTALGCIMSADLLRRYFKKEVPFSAAAFYLVYTSMEMLQFFQYQFGVYNTCGTDPMNPILTLAAHFLIWLQPITQNYYNLETTVGEKSVFKFALLGSIVATTVSTVSLAMGYFGEYVNLEKVPIVGPKLCSYQGPFHLYWEMPYHPLWGYRPLGFSWMVFTILPYIFKKSQSTGDWFHTASEHGICVLFGWMVSIACCLYFTGNITEHWSLWCLHSMAYLVLPYVTNFITIPLKRGRRWNEKQMREKEEREMQKRN